MSYSICNDFNVSGFNKFMFIFNLLRMVCCVFNFFSVDCAIVSGIVTVLFRTDCYIGSVADLRYGTGLVCTSWGGYNVILLI